MSEWKKVILEDITTRIGDGLHGTPKYDSNGGYYFVNGNNLKNGKVIIKSDTKRVSKDEALKYAKPLSDKSILLSINGTIGSLAIYNYEPCMLGKSACYINVSDEIDVKYLYYHFLDEEFQFYLEMIATGTTIPNVPLKGIRQYSFKLPSLEEQKAIAEVLSSLDDKIDLLHKQNKTLEELAQTLFRQWFVKEVGDDIELSELGNFVSTIDNRGKTPPNQAEETPYPVIEVNALGKNDRLVDYSVIRKYVDKETFDNWFRKTPNKYDTLVSTVGSIGAFSMFILEKGNIAQNVIALHAETISPFYLYEVLKYKKDEIMQLDIGGVQPSIKVPHLLSIEIPIPNKEKLVEFDTQVIEYVHKMELNYKQIKNLENMRYTLLPKLMSGEVKVKLGDIHD